MLVRCLATLLLAAPAWAVLGYLATAPLGRAYGWSGHPSIPAAPAWVYAALYLGVLPLASIAAAWWITGRVAAVAARTAVAAKYDRPDPPAKEDA